MSFKEVYLKPENKVFSDIMGNGKLYTVPPFQRDYGWEEEQLDELWNDILHMRETRTQHFMGYLVFQSQSNKHFDIIDGQQRLVTLSLLMIAVLARFKSMENNGEDAQENARRRKFYHDNYIGVLDTVSLSTAPKITMNRHNKRHFNDIATDYEPPHLRNIIATNRKLNKALDFFRKRIEKLAYTGEQLADFLNDAADGLLFTTITVNDDLNAYIVFETLNARGMHLSAPDLFKNYLLSIMAKSERFTEENAEDMEVRWASIINQLGATHFTSFLRSHIGVTEKIPSKKDLYQVLKRKVSAPEDVLHYLKHIEHNAAIYAALQKPDDPFWVEHDSHYRDAKPYLETMDVFNIKTPLSLLISAYNAYRDTPKDFIQILRWIEVVSVRYNIICSNASNDQEKIYNNIAKDISNTPGLSLKDIKDILLKRVYPDDEEFKRDFARKTMPSRRSSRKIVHLLRAIERHASQGKNPPSDLTLEHVLPFAPGAAWQEAFGLRDYPDAIDRLGNMALLSKKDNMADEPFSEKRAMLANSDYVINQKIAGYTEWNNDTLTAYQEWLAKQAAAVWKID